MRAQLDHITLAVRQGVLNPEDEAAMGFFVTGALAATPQVTGIAFVRPDLTVRRYNRSDYQAYHEASAANLPAVTQILAGPELRWVGPLWSAPLYQPILALHASLNGPGEGARDLLGVIVAAVSIAELSRYMAAIADDIGQTPFPRWARPRARAPRACI